MKCLILAAGDGGRLSQVSDPKTLARIAGMPLIEHSIATAQQAGVNDFYVVTGYASDRVETLLSEVSRRRRVSITPIKNPKWELGNGYSLLAGRERIHEPFLLLMADHILERAILDRLLSESLEDGEVILAGDFGVDKNQLIDLDDVTKLVVDDRQLVAIGKQLERYDAFDTGAFVCSPQVFGAAEESAESGDPSVSGAIRCLAAKGKVKVVDVQDHDWVDVDTPNDLRNAERLLFKNLSKPEDGFISRTINRRISTAIFTPLLLKLFPRITANLVSVLAFAVSVAASLAFFIGLPIVGGIAIQLASILDGSDGEVARLKKLQSPFGNFFDAVVDRYSDGFILFGMFYYMLTASAIRNLLGPPSNALVVGISMLAILGTLMVSYTSAKSVTDFGYRYGGRWTAAGRGRDLRLFILALGGVAALIHPISVFVAVLAVALLTTGIVLWRVWVSWSYFVGRRQLIGANTSAVIFDFDGTIANTMPYLSDLAVGLMTDSYEISNAEARRKYLETTGLDFRSQIEAIFPGHSSNGAVAVAMESGKRERILEHPLFDEVVPVLRFFEERGIKRFVCSSTQETIVRQFTKKAGIYDLLDGCFGYRPGFTKGQQIEYILRQYNLRPEEVIFVGDSLLDYDFVKDSGVQFVAIRRLFEEHEFRSRGLSSVRDLTALVSEWRRSDGAIHVVNGH
ncbi:MAG: NTP transferase domain-containing protein [Chloroflexi bacterium]|nr:NTP transferase domain-containing protein [Chloroflexota bacterium]